MANPGPASLVTVQSVAVVTPVNTSTNSTPQGTNAYRLLGVARGVSLNATGDAATMSIINSSSWVPALIVTANGQVSGVAGSIATAAIAVNSGAAGAAPVIKANAALTNNSAANSAIALATTIANLANTAQTLYINVGTALANATVDVFLYGYDVT
jgi:hypothetical protein